MLADIEKDARKIKFCQVFIGQTKEDILAQSPDEIPCEEAMRESTERLGEGNVEEEAWMALKQLERVSHGEIDLGRRPQN